MDKRFIKNPYFTKGFPQDNGIDKVAVAIHGAMKDSD